MARSRSLPPELVAHSEAINVTEAEDLVTAFSQKRNIDEIEKIGTEEWITLYLYEPDKLGSKCFYCCFAPREYVKQAMQHDSWDIRIGEGLPGFTQYSGSGRTRTKYHRFGSGSVEPLVFNRAYHGLKPDHLELLEEFRHFHNLYHDRPNGRYTRFDERGEEDVVVEVSEKRVRAKLRYLRQFMAARRLFLLIFFDHHARTLKTALDGTEVSSKKIVQNDLRLSFAVGDIGDEMISRAIGKKIIAPPPITESGIWPYEKKRSRQFADFIIGTHTKGGDIHYICDEEKLGNYFGKNPDAPHYLTPVWFRRDVLRKYYDHPEKYSVEDGYLRCGGLWGLRMDNNLPHNVMVYLGDLGHLDYQEQLYWKSFNIPPVTKETSEPNFKRSFLAEFADPTSPDLLFKQKLVAFQEAWERHFGWQLFRYLHGDDAHVVKQLRVPLTDSLGEFEHQTLLLTKLVIDSLNDKQLAREIGNELKDEKSLAKFNRFLEKNAYPHQKRDLELLRLLQSIRSTAAAHGKGTQFEKLSRKLAFSDRSISEVFRGLLVQVNQMLFDLEAFFIGEKGD
jgi:hypothetical protein